VQAARVEFALNPDFAPLQGVGRVAVAVSGGSDSTALLRMLLDWATKQSTPPVILVLTVDHGLRAESAKEARIVADWCKALEISHAILPWISEKPTSGIQAKARAARYELMTHWCLEHSIPVLLTGHTADDQNETVIMRSNRTQSVRSLAGIWPQREWNGIKILRPLLALKREDLRFYLKAKGQDWLDDPSNDNRRFERVRIRQDNAGEDCNRGVVAAAAQTQVRLADDFARRWIEDHAEISSLGLVTCESAVLARVSSLEADAILLNLLCFTGKRFPPELEHRQNLLDWLGSEHLGRRTLGGALFVKRKSMLAVAREDGRIDPSEIPIPPSGQVLWDGRFKIEGPAGALLQPLGAWGDLPHKKVPQFLRLGLPAAMIDGNLAFVPYLKPNPLFNYEFIKDSSRG
jgi:tRNA(Ile)-lysidine synthase